MTPEQQELALALVVIPGPRTRTQPGRISGPDRNRPAERVCPTQAPDAILRHEDHALRATAQRVLNRRLANPPDPGRPRIIEPLG